MNKLALEASSGRTRACIRYHMLQRFSQNGDIHMLFFGSAHVIETTEAAALVHVLEVMRVAAPVAVFVRKAAVPERLIPGARVCIVTVFSARTQSGGVCWQGETCSLHIWVGAIGVHPRTSTRANLAMVHACQIHVRLDMKRVHVKTCAHACTGVCMSKRQC